MRRKFSLFLFNLLLIVALLGYVYISHPYKRALKGAPSFRCISPQGVVEMPQKGKWWVLYLWSSHLPASEKGLRNLELFWNNRPSQVEVMALGVDVDPSFLFKSSVPICYIPIKDRRGFVRQYEITFLPVFLVVDAQGRLRQKFFDTEWMEVKRYIDLELRLERGYRKE